MRKKRIKLIKFILISLILSRYIVISTFAQVNTFNDIKGNWAQSEIDIFIKNGYIYGYEDNTFRPNNFINREEVASILTNIKNNKDTNIDKLLIYWDNKEISNWARSSVEGAIENGYMGGYNDITFKPKNNITRAESVVVLNRILTGNKVELPKNEIAKPIFSYSYVPTSIKNKMLGKSMPLSKPISFDQLSYLKLSYYGFDGKYHVGEMVVNTKVAKEVVDIFKELLENKYPIEKIKLIDDYNADDNLSMENNNSSSFCYRAITNGSSLSKHSLGLAIDINPIQNQYVTNNKVLPLSGNKYLNRNYIRKGMIVKNDVCYNAFVKRGWTWGGNWKTIKDYQHFQKNI